MDPCTTLDVLHQDVFLVVCSFLTAVRSVIDLQRVCKLIAEIVTNNLDEFMYKAATTCNLLLQESLWLDTKDSMFEVYSRGKQSYATDFEEVTFTISEFEQVLCCIEIEMLVNGDKGICLITIRDDSTYKFSMFRPEVSVEQGTPDYYQYDQEDLDKFVLVDSTIFHHLSCLEEVICEYERDNDGTYEVITARHEPLAIAQEIWSAIAQDS